MDFGLSGKTALVLGASRGLGAACAAELAREGVKVYAAARSSDVIAKWAAADSAFASVEPVELDLSEPSSVAKLCDFAATLDIDILINNCGGPPPGPALGTGADAWRASYEAMALPLITLTNTVLPGMIARGFGRIITIASSGVISPIPNLALSNGVRGALAGWSKTLASEVASKGVTVNMVLPGRIATDRLRQLDEGKARASGASVEEVETASKATIPAGRYGSPEEFAAVAAFLASTRASYVTGSLLRVDGGMLRNM